MAAFRINGSYGRYGHTLTWYSPFEILPFIARRKGADRNSQDISAQIAQDILKIVTNPSHRIVNLWQNIDAQRRLQNEIDDYFFDVANENMGLSLEPDEMDMLEQSILSIAKARFPI